MNEKLNENKGVNDVKDVKDDNENEINPHMPQYIIKAPWYLNQNKPGLKHQRYKKLDKIKIEEERNKKIYINNNNNSFCKNCGSITHEEKFCLERTRKRKINHIKKNDDDYICITQDLGYDGNRDRWVGYNPDNFKYVFEEYEKIEEEKKKRKEEELNKKYEQNIKKKKKNENINENSDTDHDSDTSENQKNIIQNVNEKNRNMARNLRIREDTAKYLYNLSLNSAFYDPKSRSMREDPFLNIKNNSIKQLDNYYKGENYYNNTGDAIKSKKLEIFAWQTYKRGENVHFNAQPTQLELLYQEFLEKKKKIIEQKQEHILKNYNCENLIENNIIEDLSHTEVYTEYKPINQLNIEKKRKINNTSKYQEDVYILNHSSIFGSYYDRENKKWGYKCCYITDKFQKCLFE